MKVKVKKLHPEAVIPKYAKPGDAGLDLVAVSIESTKTSENDIVGIRYDSGLAFEIPEGNVGLLFPRSSICNTEMMMHNSVGVIDSGYRGSVSATFLGDIYGKIYKIGEKFAQLVIVPIPEIELVESEELSETERGTGSYGSTGN